MYRENQRSESFLSEVLGYEHIKTFLTTAQTFQRESDQNQLRMLYEDRKRYLHERDKAVEEDVLYIENIISITKWIRKNIDGKIEAGNILY